MQVLLERQFPTGLVVYTRISPVARMCPQLTAFIQVASCQRFLTLSGRAHPRLAMSRPLCMARWSRASDEH